MKNNQLTHIFDELDGLREFCVEYGYIFREGDLYNNRSPAWRNYQKLITGKRPKDMWDIDYARYKEREATRYVNHR